jgi:hypothetical protein
MLMGYREYARHRGVSLGAVQKALRDGRINATPEKKIDAESADRDWQLNTDATRVAVSVIETTTPPAQKEIFLPPPAADGGQSLAPEDMTGADKVANEYRAHRSERERYSSLKQKLEYEQLVGQTINVDEAKRIAFTSFRSLRDAVMNVAARIKDQLAAETDPQECERLLEDELAAALGSIDVGKLLVDQED